MARKQAAVSSVRPEPGGRSAMAPPRPLADCIDDSGVPCPWKPSVPSPSPLAIAVARLLRDQFRQWVIWSLLALPRDADQWPPFPLAGVGIHPRRRDRWQRLWETAVIRPCETAPDWWRPAARREYLSFCREHVGPLLTAVRDAARAVSGSAVLLERLRDLESAHEAFLLVASEAAPCESVYCNHGDDIPKSIANGPAQPVLWAVQQQAARLLCVLADVETDGGSSRPPLKAAMVTPDAGATHSDDFRSVNWFGVPHTFTRNQAKVVKVLWDHWERGTPDVSNEALDGLDVNQIRFDLIFRGNQAWGEMIVPGVRRGTYRLQKPAEQKSDRSGKMNRKAHV